MFVILLEISSSISHILINSMCLCLAIKKLFILSSVYYSFVLFCFDLQHDAATAEQEKVKDELTATLSEGFASIGQVHIYIHVGRPHATSAFRKHTPYF